MRQFMFLKITQIGKPTNITPIFSRLPKTHLVLQRVTQLLHHLTQQFLVKLSILSYSTTVQLKFGLQQLTLKLVTTTISTKTPISTYK